MRAVISSTFVIDREAALRRRYERQPESAWTTHLAWTRGESSVHLGLEDAVLPYATDPHDLFAAAVAADVDSTIRRLAARKGIALDRLVVIVTADTDARGALGEPGVPVGFQSMRIEIQIDRQPELSTTRLIALVERHSVMLQTLRGSLPIEIVVGE